MIKLLFFFIFSFALQRVLSQNHAALPPRGWNSYDSFCWVISESEFLQNAQLVSQKLHAHGYEYAVVDYLWYRKLVPGAYVDSLGFDVIDEWGRMIPDPGRWPSSKGGNGFSQVAKKVHEMGLKFGFHVMRGISTQAVNANTPILDISTGKAYVENGRVWYAKDIGIKERACAWMKNGFMSVDTKLGAGRAFLRSLYHQYAEWGVDFVKHDCVFGDDLDLNEITFVSEVLKELDRPIVYSLSPGTSATPAMAKQVAPLVNMYRVTGDDWDNWGDVAAHFDVSRDFAASNMIGAKGLSGNSWPDLDMLPLGWLTDPGVNVGPHRMSSLTLDEQKTQMVLWAMSKSPLMFGGDMRKLDDTTYGLITHPTLLEINAFSSNNREFPYITSMDELQFTNGNQNFQTRSLKEVRSEKQVLGLVSCQDAKAKGWFAKALNMGHKRVCWKGHTGSKQDEPFCLYKRAPLLQTDEEVTGTQSYEGKHHLLSTDRDGFCFDASSRHRHTSKELKRASFSPCRPETTQMWELSENGTLINSYSGLCASMVTMKANAAAGGVRSWTATGKKGELYLAYFNLNPKTTIISTTVSDLSRAFPSINFQTCSCKEVWSNKDYGLQGSLSASVDTHGCALFVLNCS